MREPPFLPTPKGGGFRAAVLVMTSRPLISVGISGNKSGKNLYAFMRTERGRVRLGSGAFTGGVQAGKNRWEAQLTQQAIDWMTLGNFAIATIRARVARGIGSNDQPMPKLSGNNFAVFETVDGKRVFKKRLYKGYQGEKKAAGLKPIRDLMGTGKDGGHMLDAIRVTAVSNHSVKIDISTSKARMKARANERRAPWWGFSRNDQRAIIAEARRMFKVNLTDITPILAGIGLAVQQRWMNPLRQSSVWRAA